jgi:hypothetical protein
MGPGSTGSWFDDLLLADVLEPAAIRATASEVLLQRMDGDRSPACTRAIPTPADRPGVGEIARTHEGGGAAASKGPLPAQSAHNPLSAPEPGTWVPPDIGRHGPLPRRGDRGDVATASR